VIPARYASTRLPGKPLADLCGKPMIQWVYEQACRAKLPERIIVATDDVRILEAVQAFRGEAVMTPAEMRSGTDRIAAIAKEIDADVFINIQGDEPFVEPGEIDLVARILTEDPEPVMGTLVKRISRAEELLSPNTAKVVVDRNHQALYFSRSPIPFLRDSGQMAQWFEHGNYFKHVGIYSYRKQFLLQYASWEETPLECMEKLEQLRVLEHGYAIKVAETLSEPVCVDTPEDLENARRIVTDRKLPAGKECL